MAKKVIVIGGVAGGASTAARLRRLDEEAHIILLERGEYISYANCGLPYHIGGAIEERDNLFVMTPAKFKAWLNVDVRTLNEALSINRADQEVEIINHSNGEKYRESYDFLVLSPGAEPLRPPLPGIDSAGIFSLRTVPDTDRIYQYINEKEPQKAVVVGAGYIGMEMAENLKHRGIDVTVVELAPQVLPPIDPDMAALVQQYLRALGMKLRLGNGVREFHPQDNGGLKVELSDGEMLETDLVILSIGVKPETRLAAEAGLTINRGIIVNDRMQTSDPLIYALGDAVEVKHLVTGKPAVIPLAGPANKQGRIVANNIAGREDFYQGTQGTSVLKIFEMTVATTGANERLLNAENIEYHTVTIHPNAHAGYYPGATPLSLKLLFSPGGKILGAQAAGYSGVEKRIDVLAAALRDGQTVQDLQELELAYAPPYSSAKDPVNMIGYVATNTLIGDYMPIRAEELLEEKTENIQIVDVRETEEHDLGRIAGSIHIPLGELRERLDQLDPGQEIITYCSVGLRSYLASKILTNRGFKKVRNLNGGYRTYQALKNEQENKVEETLTPDSVKRTAESETHPCATIKLDLCGLQCPGPVMKVYQKMEELPEGSILEICATDPGFATDIAAWCRRTGNQLLDRGHDGRGFTAVIRKGILDDPGSKTGTAPAVRDAAVTQPASTENDKTIVVFSSDLDRALAALVIATGAASLGRRVTLFFTFWGLNILRKPEGVKVNKPFMDGMFGKMMPRGSKKLGLSRMNMAGLGSKMIRRVMAGKNIDSLETLLEQARDLGVNLVACQMSMDVMGIKQEELLEGVEIGGVASYLDAAESSDVNLFI